MTFTKVYLGEQQKRSEISSADTYDDRKTAQFTTADNLTRNFINAKAEKQQQNVNDQYNKVYEKHKGETLLGGRLQTAKRDNSSEQFANDSRKRQQSREYKSV